jgi:hypothetical protein
MTAGLDPSAARVRVHGNAIRIATWSKLPQRLWSLAARSWVLASTKAICFNVQRLLARVVSGTAVSECGSVHLPPAWCHRHVWHFFEPSSSDRSSSLAKLLKLQPAVLAVQLGVFVLFLAADFVTAGFKFVRAFRDGFGTLGELVREALRSTNRSGKLRCR